MRYLVFGGLRSIMRNRPALLCIIVISFMLTSFYLTFELVSCLAIYHSKSLYDERLREIEVVFSDEIDATKVIHLVNETVDAPNFDYGVVCNAGGKTVNKQYSSPQEENLNEPPIACVVHRYTAGERLPVYLPAVVDGQTIDPYGKSGDALFPAAYNEYEAQIGKTVRVNDRDYQCVGLLDASAIRFGGNIIIGQQRFAADCKAKAVFIGFTEKPAASVTRPLKNALLAIDPNASIHLPVSFDWNLFWDVVKSMKLPLFLLLLVFSSMLLAVIGLLETERERLYIFRLCGIRGRHLFGRIFFQLFWMLLMGSPFGMALCFIPAVGNTRGFTPDMIRLTDLAITAGILLLFCLITALLAFFKIRRGTVRSHMM